MLRREAAINRAVSEMLDAMSFSLADIYVTRGDEEV